MVVLKFVMETLHWCDNSVFCPIEISCYAKFFTPVFLRSSRRWRDVAPKTPGQLTLTPFLLSFPIPTVQYETGLFESTDIKLFFVI